MVKKFKKDSKEVTAYKQYINGLTPEELAKEFSREELSLEAQREGIKKDPQISGLKDQVIAFKKALEETDQVIEAKENLEKVRETHKDESQSKAEEDLKILRAGWVRDLGKTKKKIKLMRAALKKHVESGALKFNQNAPV